MRLAALILPVAALVSSCGPFGDPGAPIAYVGTQSHSLAAVAVLMCGSERVLDIGVVEDVGRNVVTPGKTLWELRSSDDSGASLFYVDAPPSGFSVVVAATAPLTGDLAITVRTTRQSFIDGVTTHRLPVGRVSDHGHTKTIQQLPGLARSRCS